MPQKSTFRPLRRRSSTSTEEDLLPFPADPCRITRGFGQTHWIFLSFLLIIECRRSILFLKRPMTALLCINLSWSISIITSISSQNEYIWLAIRLVATWLASWLVLFWRITSRFQVDCMSHTRQQTWENHTLLLGFTRSLIPCYGQRCSCSVLRHILKEISIREKIQWQVQSSSLNNTSQGQSETNVSLWSGQRPSWLLVTATLFTMIAWLSCKKWWNLT